MPPTSKPIRLLADGIYNILAINSFYILFCNFRVIPHVKAGCAGSCLCRRG